MRELYCTGECDITTTQTKKNAGSWTRRLSSPAPVGGSQGSGGFQGILGGEIFIAEIMGHSLMINVPCVNVQTIGQV